MKKFTFLLIFVFIIPIFFAALPQKAEAKYYICCVWRDSSGVHGQLEQFVSGLGHRRCSKGVPFSGNCSTVKISGNFDINANLKPAAENINLAVEQLDLNFSVVKDRNELTNVIISFLGFLGPADNYFTDTPTKDFSIFDTPLKNALNSFLLGYFGYAYNESNITAGSLNIIRDFTEKFQDAVGAAGDQVQKFGVLWTDGRVSLFGNLAMFENPFKFYPAMPANSVPGFIRQDKTGKVFLWNGQNGTWSLHLAPFPSPITTTGTGGKPVKGDISVLATKISTAVNPIVSSFTSNTNLRVVNNTPSTIVPNIADMLRFLGFSSYQATSADRNLGPTLTGATKSFDSAFGLPVNDTFDADEANALKDFNSKFTSAVNNPSFPANVTNFGISFASNKSFSSFDPATGVFKYFPPYKPPTGCGGIKQPPCVTPFQIKCCDESGDLCTDPTDCGGGLNCTCSSVGSACKGSGLEHCRDVF